MITKRKYAFPFVFFVLFLSGNCIVSYRDFPDVDPNIVTKYVETNEIVFFKITRFPNLSWNEEKVKEELIANGWKEIENYPPEKGYYIDIQATQKDPSLAAVIFGYLSYASFTILPSYSGQDGASITFQVFKDGEKVKNFNYKITRKGFIWLLTLPVLWINYYTYDEFDAYKAVIQKFAFDFEQVNNSADKQRR